MNLKNIDRGELTVEPLEEAHTFPAKWYTSEQIFEAEQVHIFRKTWQLVGTLAQFEKPGDFVTAEIAGEPIVIVRDRNGDLCAFSNVCTHRGGPVASGAGNRGVPFFQCRYHAWTFNFDGSVRSAPGLPTLQQEKAKLCLPAVRVETWRTLVFVNLDSDARPLADDMAGIDEVMPIDPIGKLKFQFRETHTIESNWKIFQYNSHECYHCRTIHSETVINVMHPDSLETLKTGDNWLYTRYEGKDSSDDARASDVQSFASAGAEVSAEAERSGFYALHLFPNTMITYTPPGYAALVQFIPQSAGRTLFIRDHYFNDADAAKVESVRSFREAVIAEDIEICEVVQKNMSSRLFNRGRFVAKNEWQSYWFDQQVRKMMARAADGFGE